MLQHVPFKVTSLGKGLLADGALVWPRSLVRKQMRLKMAGLLEELSTMQTLMWFDAIVTKDVRNQVVFRSVRLLAHAALPAFQAFSYIHTVGFVDLHVNI